MHPVVRAAVAVAILAALAGPAPHVPPAATRPAASASSVALVPPARCPPLTVPAPERDPSTAALCIPLPPSGADRLPARMLRLGAAQAAPALRLVAEREMVPRLPDRPDRYSDYQLPVAPAIAVLGPGSASFDQPANATPRLGIDIETERSTPVSLVDLEGQQGDAEVLLVGQLYGVTVAVLHRVASDHGERALVVLYGNLARPGPGVVSGARLTPMSLVGFVGVSDDEDVPRLYLEVRELTAPLPAAPLHLGELVSAARSVAVDPRNVLPLRR